MKRDRQAASLNIYSLKSGSVPRQYESDEQTQHTNFVTPRGVWSALLVSFWRLCIEEKEDRGETKRKGERAGRATRRRKEKEISIRIPYLSALSVGHDGQCQDGQDRKHAGTAGGRRGVGAQELARAQASAPEVRKLNFGGSGRRGRHCIEQRYGLLVDAVR